MNELAGKIVLVTGAAKGQGRSHAITAAAHGALIVACDIAEQIPCATEMGTGADLAETARMVEAVGGTCLALKADTRDPAAMRGVVAEALDRFGSVDVLLANAGIAAVSTVRDMPYAVWRDVVDVNLSGVANSIRAVAPTMVEQGWGRIIATSSSVGREGGPNNASYTAAKWGVIGLVKSVAIELARHGVTVNTVNPMSVATDMCHNEATYGLFRPDLGRPTAADVSDAFTTLNPMAVPWLAPRDISDVVMFLLSEQARYITGVALDVTAGQSAFHLA